MMPHPSQTPEQFLHACAAAAGEFLPRATPEQIEALKAKGYVVTDWPMDADPEFGIDAHVLYNWSLTGTDEFQDQEPSMNEADAWASALEHSQLTERADAWGRA